MLQNYKKMNEETVSQKNLTRVENESKPTQELEILATVTDQLLPDKTFSIQESVTTFKVTSFINLFCYTKIISNFP